MLQVVPALACLVAPACQDFRELKSESDIASMAGTSPSREKGFVFGSFTEGAVQQLV